MSRPSSAPPPGPEVAEPGLAAASADPSAAPTLGARPGERSQVVQVYDSVLYLCELVAEFLAVGLNADDAVMAIATERHRAAVAERLRAKGFDVARACAAGQLTFLDAEATLREFMRGGAPDWDRFKATIGARLDRIVASGGSARVRAYGEMVDLLWNSGNTTAAVALEKMWNDLQGIYPFPLVRAYTMGGFYKEAGDLHQLRPMRTYLLDERPGPLEHTELARGAGAAPARPKALTRITAAIAEAITADEVYAAVVDEVARALDASSAALWVLGGDGVARLVRAIGYSENARQAVAAVSLAGGPRLPAVDAVRTGLPIFIASQAELVERYPHVGNIVTPGRSYGIACLPIVVQGTTLGGVGFTFDDKPPLTDEDRAFLTIVTHYTGQALERVRLLDGERESRARAEAAMARMALLNRAARAFSDARHDLRTLLDTIVAEITVSHGDACGIVLLARDGEALELAAFRHWEPAAEAAARDLVGHVPRDPRPGLLGDVIASGRPFFVPEVESAGLLAHVCAPYDDWFARFSPGSLGVVPLVVHGRIIGALAAMRRPGAPAFGADDDQLLIDIAERAALAIDSARLHEDNQRARERAEILYGLAGAVIDAASADDVFAAALDAIERALGTKRASILAYDPDGVMRFKAWIGLSPEYRRAVEGHSPWPRDARAPEPVLVPDVEADDTLAAYRPLLRQERIAALGFIPLVAQGRLLGKFMVYYERPRVLASHELEMARAIANHAAAALARFAALAELQETVRFNEMFTGILGHDLRNPLAGIMTSTQLAMMRSESENITKPLGRILRSGHRMARMIDQLLDFTRVRVGNGIPLEPRPLELVTLLRQVIDELEAGNPEWRIRLEATGDDTGQFDADRLSQVFSNLVANALQHGTPGAAVVVRFDGSAADAVVVEVWNQGVVPAELLPRLFEPMGGGGRRPDRSQGLGLGLFISQEVVRAHRGRLEVRSREPEGTTFATYLPRG